jgi:hypothetical protein
MAFQLRLSSPKLNCGPRPVGFCQEADIPKRVFGLCPICYRYIAKRDGKLKQHFPTERQPRGTFLKPAKKPIAQLCPGGGRRVPTHQHA